MRNNEYTFTPTWFNKILTEIKPITIDTNNGIYNNPLTFKPEDFRYATTFNCYNKYTIILKLISNTDLYIKDTALIAEVTKTLLVLKYAWSDAKEILTNLGDLVTDKDWYTSSILRIIGGTTLIINFKANEKSYGLVFYDKNNKPIIGHTPTKDGEVTLNVPSDAYYFRVCNNVVLNSGFFIKYSMPSSYTKQLEDLLYKDGFLNFTTLNNSINLGIDKSSINTNGFGLIFKYPLYFDIDERKNILVSFNTNGLIDFINTSDNPINRRITSLEKSNKQLTNKISSIKLGFSRITELSTLDEIKLILMDLAKEL